MSVKKISNVSNSAMNDNNVETGYSVNDENKHVELVECELCGAIMEDKNGCSTEGCKNNLLDKEDKQLEDEKEKQDIVRETFIKCKNRPSDEELEEMKRVYGELYYFVQDEESVYVLRTLKRGEYKQIRQNKQFTNEKFEEKLVEKCLLYPKNIISFINWDAGLVASLSQVVMNISKFYSQEEISVLTRKL